MLRAASLHEAQNFLSHMTSHLIGIILKLRVVSNYSQFFLNLIKSYWAYRAYWAYYNRPNKPNRQNREFGNLVSLGIIFTPPNTP